MSIIKPNYPVEDWGPSLTKQAYKDETDVNRIMARFQETGTLSHIQKFAGEYGNYSDFDFLSAQLALTRGREIFDQLPIEVKREFNNNPTRFFEFVNNPENADKLDTVLPELAKPGTQLIDPAPHRVANKAASAAASEPQASENQTPQGVTGGSEPNAPAPSQDA